MERVEEIRNLIDQSKPFRSLQSEAIVSLLFTVDRVREVALGPLREHALSAEQYNVLRILRGRGPGGLSTYAVAKRMVSRAPNITRLVDKLVAKSLLRRAPSLDDRRVTNLEIAGEGLRLLSRLDGPIERSTRRAMEGLSEEEIRTFLDLLARIRRPLLVPRHDRDGDRPGRKNKEAKKERKER